MANQKFNFPYTTDGGKIAVARLTADVANDGGFGAPNQSFTPNGAIKREHMRHIGLREDAAPYRRFTRPCKSTSVGGYEQVGQAKTIKVNGVNVACHIVGSTGEKTRGADVTK
ncbi:MULTISPECIES: hypothetical protein [Gammaproteobacteria]|uniref:hypothetical protein n=1 Tax=Gammaproteobacteria TaxID=1236 RepID=UPI001115A322|nr:MULTISPECIES: hypothetical protein [Gammaproteobacteria]